MMYRPIFEQRVQNLFLLPNPNPVVICMHEKHECHDDVASKPKRSRYLGAKCIQDLKEVKEENSSVQKML
jgi:hypothetical protein